MLILASASPRRQALLAHLGLPFRVVVPEVDEDTPPSSQGRPEALAETLALAKAKSVARHATDALIIAADTMVVDGDTILGKPRDATHAQAMLRRLRARQHRVITGLAVVHPATRRTAVVHVITLVRMRDYAEAEIAAYVARGEPLDKAGAYAIQDEAFHPVHSYDGCYCNVVGLPLQALILLLRRAGVDITPNHLAGLPAQCQACPIEV